MPHHFYYLLLRKRFIKFVTSSKWSFVWGGGVGETFGEGGGAGPHRPSWGCFGKRRCIKLGDFILLRTSNVFNTYYSYFISILECIVLVRIY